MEDRIATRPKQTVEEVFIDVSPRLWRSVLAYAGDPDVASDAVAEAFAQVLRRGANVDDIRAWVWTAAFRIAAGELRSRSLSGGPLDRPEEGPDVGRVYILTALHGLSPAQRGALVLYYYAGYTTPEIARILGRSRGAVRVHLSRGRRRLRRLLEMGEQQ